MARIKTKRSDKRSHDAKDKHDGKKKQRVAAAAPKQDDSKSIAAATLKELLGGMDLDAFFSQYFEKKPLHVRSNGKHKVLLVSVLCDRPQCVCWVVPYSRTLLLLCVILYLSLAVLSWSVLKEEGFGDDRGERVGLRKRSHDLQIRG